MRLTLRYLWCWFFHPEDLRVVRELEYTNRSHRWKCEKCGHEFEGSA
jgi:hypothetical protein